MTVEVSPIARPVEVLTTATQGVEIDVAGNDSGTVDPPTVVTDPSNGTATVGSDGRISYVPTGTFTGHDDFEYRICADDGSGLCSTADVTVLVEFVAEPDLATTSAGRSVLVDVASNDIGDAEDADVTTQPSNGTATVGARRADRLHAGRHVHRNRHLRVPAVHAGDTAAVRPSVGDRHRRAAPRGRHRHDDRADRGHDRRRRQRLR